MIFEAIAIGGRRNVAYIVGDELSREVAIIDAGYKLELILDRVDQLDAKVRYVLATHRHRDHISRAWDIKAATGACLAAYGVSPDIDFVLNDGDKLAVGGMDIEVLYTPGHTEDSVCFLVDGQRLLTGDTLYVGRVSKSVPYSKLRMRRFYQSLHDRVMRLDDDVEVWPGHDVGPSPSSTIGHERRTNIVLQMNFEGFVSRKWDREIKEWVVGIEGGTRR